MSRVILARGLPGSGKTTLINKHFAKQHRPVHSFAPSKYSPGHGTWVYSADDFHINADQKYVYVPANVSDAHRRCLEAFMEGLELLSDEVTLVVDNTNVSAVEIAPYIATARVAGLEPEVWTCVAPLELCLERQTHDVPFNVMLKMHQTFMSESWPSFFPAQEHFLTT